MSNATTGLGALFLLMLMLVFPASGISSSIPATEVVIEETVFVGALLNQGRVAAYRGLPFAEPPTGAARWHAAKQSPLPSGRIDATNFKPACYQGDHTTTWYRDKIISFGGDPSQFAQPQVSEDCLYLNIWTPIQSKQSLPVVVFIHGGSNRGGWAYEPDYHGSRLAAQGAVIVSVPYRLGVFGFFSHPDLEIANFALTDLAAALGWLRAHIAEFGGDSKNITLMGESSGGNNIIHMLASPITAGLFDRAIVQSAGWALNERSDRWQHLAAAAALTDRLGLPKSDVQALRNISARTLLASAEITYRDVSFDMVVDGKTLLEPTGHAMRSGRLHWVDLLIGSNRDEWRSYLPANVTIDDSDDIKLSARAWRAVKSHFASSEDPIGALDQLITAHHYVCPSQALAKAVHEADRKSWRYLFAKQRDGERAAAEGAYHGAELPYVFDTHASWLPTSVEDRKLGQSMMHYWLSFAENGDPNLDAAPQWPSYRSEQPRVMLLDESVQSVAHPSDPLCDIPGFAPALAPQ